jgi:hypothetical protein
MRLARLGIVALALIAAAVAAPSAAAAQTPPPAPAVERSAAPSPAQPQAPPRDGEAIAAVDAHETRQQLMQILSRYPPAVGRVLKLDPSLMSSQTYLAPYPALAAFLAQHPEIAHNHGFFLSAVPGPGGEWMPLDAESRAIDMWRNMFEGLTVFLVVVAVTIGLAWLIKTFIEHRRWQRMTRVQAEVHNKLLDRFASNADVIAYMQTAAGSRFLESAPIATEATPRGLSAPLGRILWSVQVGVVLAFGGMGLQFVSRRVIHEAAQPIFALGALALFLGAGFVAAAAISYALSRKLGLFDASPAIPADDGSRTAS